MRGTIIRGLEAKNGEYLITSERGEALKKMGADVPRSLHKNLFNPILRGSFMIENI